MVVVPVLNEARTVAADVRPARGLRVAHEVVVEEDAVAFGVIAARGSLRCEEAAI